MHKTILLILSVVVQAQDAENVEQVGNFSFGWRWEADEIIVDGDYAYIADGGSAGRSYIHTF